MPAALTYPGVYVEEIPSGVRTITGVATSITAFIGRALRGPVNDPVTINSFGDFERIFGGLWVGSTVGYAVRDFYLNGGSQALIVRLHNGAKAAEIALPTTSPSPNDLLRLVAANVGAWGNNLKGTVDYQAKDKDKLFNLIISEVDAVSSQVLRTEKFLNLSVNPDDPRYVVNVLKDGSALVGLKKDSTGKFIVPNVRPKQDTTTNATTDGSDGGPLTKEDFTGTGKQAGKEGLFSLEKADLFNLLCISPYLATGEIETALIDEAIQYCEKRRAIFLVDPPVKWNNKEKAKSGIATEAGMSSKNAAIFFPRLNQPDPLRDNQLGEFVPCGAVAGVFSRTDTQRGVWKAPAGLEATLAGVPQLSTSLTDAENGELNPLGINCLRAMTAAGRVIWGSRTRVGDDRLASEWKYIPVRRTALYIEESLYRGTQWVVFEPNDEPLWAQIRLNIGAFMHNLFRQGAFQGKTPREAYFVKCDKETTTQNDINLGIVNIVVGFAPLKPAEFVVIKLQQMAGQIET
ncbi:MAG TPA: phage tail sheath C-terminal domain-containing protein [Blastocatellia bacterium]|nr:phage tail sheath C-terminal domain-containing protein [Blastocatellia bacterium]